MVVGSRAVVNSRYPLRFHRALELVQCRTFLFGSHFSTLGHTFGRFDDSFHPHRVCEVKRVLVHLCRALTYPAPLELLLRQVLPGTECIRLLLTFLHAFRAMPVMQ